MTAEQAIREDLAAAYRLVAHFGWDDLIFTHISARVPGPEHHFLINPYGMLFEEITASSLMKVGLDGKKVEDSPWPVNPAGFTIHSAVHEVRADAQCVMHLHTVDGTAVSVMDCGLLPHTQMAMLVHADLAYHEYEGIALDHAERPRLQQDLGDKNGMLLWNHGTLTLGRTVGEAFTRMYTLEKSVQHAGAVSGWARHSRGPTRGRREGGSAGRRACIRRGRHREAALAGAQAKARPYRSDLQGLSCPHQVGAALPCRQRRDCGCSSGLYARRS